MSVAGEFVITCPKCQFELERGYWNQEQAQPCSHCQTMVKLLVFPAAVGQAPVALPNPFAAEGEATCYNHQRKQAHVPCAHCGRFLCTVCDIEFRGEHWCAHCLKASGDAQVQPLFERNHTHYDAVALFLATLPVLALWPSLLCAPAALFLALRHWNDDQGFLPRSKVRLYVTVVLSLIQIGGWVALVVFVAMRALRLWR